MTAERVRALLFDRETLVRDVPYNGDPDRVELTPTALERCSCLTPVTRPEEVAAAQVVAPDLLTALRRVTH